MKTAVKVMLLMLSLVLLDVGTKVSGGSEGCDCSGRLGNRGELNGNAWEHEAALEFLEVAVGQWFFPDEAMVAIAGSRRRPELVNYWLLARC